MSKELSLSDSSKDSEKKPRRNIQDCKFWRPRGKKTHYCTIDSDNPFKQCHGVCKEFCPRIAASQE